MIATSDFLNQSITITEKPLFSSTRNVEHVLNLSQNQTKPTSKFNRIRHCLKAMAECKTLCRALTYSTKMLKHGRKSYRVAAALKSMRGGFELAQWGMENLVP